MYNKIKRLMITSVVIAMGIGLMGCAKTDQKSGDANASTVEAEDLPQAEKSEDGADETGDAEDAAVGETGNKAASGGQQTADSADEGQNDGNGPSLGGIPDGEPDLYASIYETGDMQFTVTEIYTEILDDGTMLAMDTAPGTEEASQLITVVYDENTVFAKERIWNGGADHEEKAATAAGLQKGLSADIWGSYEGDIFHAEAVRIIEVIL